jgi:hypothetical protein
MRADTDGHGSVTRPAGKPARSGIITVRHPHLGAVWGLGRETFLLICPMCGDRNMTASPAANDGITFPLPLHGECGHTWTIM